MTIKDDVLAAFGRLAPDDDAAWNKDGTPKLEAIRNAAGDQKISRDEMIQSIGDLRRPEVQSKAPETPPPEQPPAPPEQAAPPPAPPAPAADDRPDTVNVQKPQVDGVEDTETPDKAKLVAEAEDHIKEIDSQIALVAPHLEEALTEMKRLQAIRDKEVEVVEANTVLLTHAESVKRVQAQTQANAVANKARIAVAQTALAASGFKPSASPLDAALSGRKRTPEMAKNMASYHTFRQGERVAERLGTG